MHHLPQPIALSSFYIWSCHKLFLVYTYTHAGLIVVLQQSLLSCTKRYTCLLHFYELFLYMQGKCESLSLHFKSCAFQDIRGPYILFFNLHFAEDMIIPVQLFLGYKPNHLRYMKNNVLTIKIIQNILGQNQVIIMPAGVVCNI